MYSVSLLPYEYRMIDAKARKKSIILYIMIGVMGTLLASYLIMAVFFSGKSAELTGIKAENASVEIQISRLAELKTISDEVNILLKDAIISAGTNPDWERLIANIGNSVTENIRLNKIDMIYESEKSECQIMGFSKDYQSVSDWIKVLQQTPGIGEIQCIFSLLTDETRDNWVDFELTFPLSQGVGYKIPEVTGNEY